MARESLRDLAADLRTELGRAHELDPATRAALHGLAREVEAALDQTAEPASAPAASLPERLSDRLRALEVTHPKLSATIGNLVDTLAFYGL